jgi:hypothetical protein
MPNVALGVGALDDDLLAVEIAYRLVREPHLPALGQLLRVAARPHVSAS